MWISYNRYINSNEWKQKTKEFKKLDTIKFMKCKRCSKQSIETELGICLICEPRVVQGIEKEASWYRYQQGTEIESKTGRTDENIWMRKV